MIAPVAQAQPIFVASGEGAGPAWMSVKAGAAGTGGAETILRAHGVETVGPPLAG
jgi:hypothetical protein